MRRSRLLGVLSVSLVLVAAGASAQFEEPSHPLSQIDPVDVALNMSNQVVKNVSAVSFSNPSGGGYVIDNYEISDQSGVSELELVPPDGSGQGQFQVNKANLNLSGNNISEVNRINGQLAQGLGTSNLTEVLNEANKAGNNNINMSGNRITNLSDPTNPQDAATKNYVDTTDNTIQDDQTLQNVLALNNTVGGENINFNETSSIQASGTNAITLDNQQNIGIPNGNIDAQGNRIVDTAASDTVRVGDADSNTVRIDAGGSGDAVVSSGDGSSGSAERLRVTGSSGEADVDVSNSDVDLQGNSVTSSGGEVCIGDQCA